jgi:signal transduction histidine kinase
MCKKVAMLHEFIDINRVEIIDRCRAKVSARSVPAPTAAEIEHGVPVFLSQLAEALRIGLTGNPEIGKIAVKHGHDLLMQGFTVSQVVHDYGDVCQTITEMAVELDVPISAQDFRTLNGCLDNAIAGAVTEYGRGRNQFTLDGEVARGSEKLGFLAHELRNLANTAVVAFEVLKTGNVGVAGSTGTVLHRSLTSMRVLIDRSLDEVRLTQELQNLAPVQMAEFIREIAPTARLEARAAGVTLTILPVDESVTIQADRRILASVMENVLQNALKFTRPHTTVTLRVVAGLERVCIEVEDECGGLRVVDPSELFLPFEQRNADRSGLGLGLAFCRWAVEASNGRIHARSLPGRGCVFTIDMPRLPVAAGAAV